MSDPPLLGARDVCTFYGRSQILFDVSVRAPRTGAVAILGRNGAGKTTLMRTIVGELKARQGRIAIDGSAIESDPWPEITATRPSSSRTARRSSRGSRSAGSGRKRPASGS